MPSRRSVLFVLAILSATLCWKSLPAQERPPVDSGLFGELKWRSIGPHRASRTVAAAGHPQPAVHVLHGAGQRRRLEDDRRRDGPGSRSSTTSRPARSAPSPSRHPIPTSSTSAAAKGSSSRSLDRRRRLQIDRRRQDVDASRAARCAADSRPRRRSHATPTGCSSPRSAIRTDRTKSAASSARLDGGRTFQKVLYKDENTGGNDVDIDPSNPDIVYATLWEERQGPWENAVWAGTGGGIFKSTDGGTPGSR